MNYYKALMRGTFSPSESALTDEDRMLDIPVLVIGGTKDMVTRADQIQAQTEPWAGNGFTLRTVDTGHWMTYEDRAGVSSILMEFAEA
jgi:pimeloyl-ACP methyl ester carboxylesterase